jgi:hypothetical protein
MTMEQRPDGVVPGEDDGPRPDAPDGGAVATAESPVDGPTDRGHHPADPPERPDPGRTARLVTLALVVAALLVGGAIRAWLLFHQPVTSDEAVAGLISHQILHGHTYAFFWGQPFGGVEPYVVAAVFAVLGQGSLTLGLTPVLLAAVAAVLVWRVARRLVGSPAVALLAGALAWVAPFPVVFTSTIEGGYRGVTLACGLAVLLLSLRILDGAVRYTEFIALGLVTGIGWWSLPEIAYFLIPAGLVLIGALVGSGRQGDLGRWPGRIGAAVLAFGVGALPWLWTNIGSGFASLDTSKFPGSVTPLNPGYGGRLRLFFKFTLPMYANLRRLNSGAWLFGESGTSFHRALVALAVALIAVVVVGALVLCCLRGGRCIALAVTLVAYPFLVALQPGTWFWQDGRYAVYLGPLLALVAGVACVALAERIGGRARSGRAHRPTRPRAAGLALMSLVLTVSLALTIVDFHQSFVVSGHALVSDWGNPDAAASATATSLEARGVRTGYADYWVAYKLDFLSDGRLSLTVAGTDPDRWAGLTGQVRSSHAPAWLFVPAGRMAAGLAQFAQTGNIQGPSGLTESHFVAALDRLGIPFRTVDAGPIQAVIPASPVQLHTDGSVTAR